MSEWKKVRLGDICTELSDGLHKAPLFVKGGDYIFVNAKNLCDGVIVDNDPTKKTTYEEYLKYSKPLNENTILFSIDGTIGNIARYKGEKCVLGKGACYINPNPVLVDSSYIYFQLQSPHFNSYLNCMSTGSTIKHISLKTMRNYEFTLPPLSEQRSIASILSALDGKIAVNRRICENLEAQAQALIKHWFIDFAPFKNGQFVESELGMIPEGWRVGGLFDIAEVHDSKRKPLSGMERAKMKKIYPYYGATEQMDMVDDYIFDGRYVLMGEDGSVVRENGLPYIQYVWGKIWVNNHAHVLTGKNGFTTEMLIPFLTKYNIKGLVTGAVQAKLNQANMAKIRLAIPPMSILENISVLFESLYDTYRNCCTEMVNLSTLRDTLLPKLMSGQIKV